jgi:hypothetical protein
MQGVSALILVAPAIVAPMFRAGGRAEAPGASEEEHSSASEAEHRCSGLLLCMHAAWCPCKEQPHVMQAATGPAAGPLGALLRGA